MRASPLCWRDWRGPEFGNNGSMTIRWAHENLGDWLKRLNPEVALILFGTNDLGQLEHEEYEAKTRDVVRRCLENGTIVILNTIPPASGRLEKSRVFAEVVAKIARDEKVPLVDYFGEILRRRPGTPRHATESKTIQLAARARWVALCRAGADRQTSGQPGLIVAAGSI